MSNKFDAVIAFSGGLESTYLAQLMLEKGHKVRLYYTNATGRNPCFVEATLVFRCYKKLKESFPDGNISLHYADRVFFGTHHSSENRMLHVNQAMRIACLLTDLQKFEKDALYMCGWTGEGCQEVSLNPGCYSAKQYEDMKQLPITLNQYTRLAVKPSPILTPLWGMSKKEVYEKLHPDLKDVVVLNTMHEKISTAKIQEWEEAGLPIPSYVKQLNDRTIGWKDIINNFGLYFADSYIWGQWIGHLTGLHIEYESTTPLYYASPKARFTNAITLPLSEINSAVVDFENTFTEYFKTRKKEQSNAN